MPCNRSLAGIAGLCALFAFVGLGAGLVLCRWEALDFNPSIALGQVLQICVLLFIFFAANHVYAKAHDSRKKKVEILVDMVGEILAQAQQAHSIFFKCASQESVSISTRNCLDSTLRDYSNAVNELEQVLEYSAQSPDVSGFKELRRNREEYKDLVTASPYPASLPMERITQESKLYSKIKSNLRKFQMDLAGRVQHSGAARMAAS